MASFRLSATARTDLKEIGRYSRREHGNEVTDRYLHGFAKAFERLRRHPYSAPARPEFGSDIRCLVQGRHRILYSIVVDGVLVVRIVHHAQRSAVLEQ